MKVVHVSTVDTGGAANAAYRLHQGLLMSGVDSRFLVLHNARELDDVITFETPFGDILWFILRKVKQKFIRLKTNHILEDLSDNVEVFSLPFSIYDLNTHPVIKSAEIIHLHWVANFIDYQSFFKLNKKPLVWTFHDENTLLGGIHYSGDLSELSAPLLELEQRFKKIKLTALAHASKIWPICPSPWLLKRVMSSPCSMTFKEATCIYYGIDSERFKIEDGKLARKELDLPQDKHLILLICSNLNLYRKGFDLFKGFIQKIKSDDQIEFILAGELSDTTALPFCRHLGVVRDQEKLIHLYNAVNATLIPSREDNLPNVMIESLICGTPVLGFKIGGIQDIIQDYVNGLLAEEVSIDDLYHTVIKSLSITFDPALIRQKAVETFDNNIQVSKVTELYSKSINGGKLT